MNMRNNTNRATQVRIPAAAAGSGTPHLRSLFAGSPDTVQCTQGVWMRGIPTTKDQLGAGQIGLLRIGECSPVGNRCSHRTALAYFGLKWLFKA